MSCSRAPAVLRRVVPRTSTRSPGGGKAPPCARAVRSRRRRPHHGRWAELHFTGRLPAPCSRTCSHHADNPSGATAADVANVTPQDRGSAAQPLLAPSATLPTTSLIAGANIRRRAPRWPSYFGRIRNRIDEERMPIPRSAIKATDDPSRFGIDGAWQLEFAARRAHRVAATARCGTALDGFMRDPRFEPGQLDPPHPGRQRARQLRVRAPSRLRWDDDEVRRLDQAERRADPASDVPKRESNGARWRSRFRRSRFAGGYTARLKFGLWSDHAPRLRVRSGRRRGATALTGGSAPARFRWRPGGNARHRRGV